MTAWSSGSAAARRTPAAGDLLMFDDGIHYAVELPSYRHKFGGLD